MLEEKITSDLFWSELLLEAAESQRARRAFHILNGGQY